MFKSKKMRRLLSALVCLVLFAAIALSLTACGKKEAPKPAGANNFKFVRVDKDGNEKSWDINTDETTVGAALLKEGLIEGEESQYGLYVKSVDGITADYSVDGTYWAFYIGDEYAMTGVDSTDISNGETYTFKVEKG